MARHLWSLRKGGDIPGKSILIVESYDAVLETLARFFEGGGYGVLGSRSAEDAMSFIAKNPVDVVLSAVMGLPGMKGVELAEKIREQYPQIAVFLMSGGMPPLMRVRADAVARKVFDKPFDLSDLLATIAQAVSSVS
jgi:CheY-like chemotaxis protein